MSDTIVKREEKPKSHGARHIAPVQQLEIRAEQGDGNTVTFGGYAVRWADVATIYDWLGKFEERFEAGAFLKTIQERGPSGNGMIKFFRHHGFETMTIAARFTQLEEDNIGLKFEAETIDTAVGRDLAAEVRAGVVDSLSVGFDAIQEEWDNEEESRTIKEARLWEISAVNWPAYPNSKVNSVRALERVEPFLEHLMGELRAGKVLSASNYDKLVEARDQIDQVIASATPEAEPDEADPLTEEDRSADIELQMQQLETEL